MVTAAGTVLVSGASGFVGRHLTRELLDRGWCVRALVRPDSPRARDLDPRLEVHRAALTDAAALDAALTGTTAAVYGAGAVRGADERAFRAANVAGVEALAAALCRRPAPPPLLLISSLAASRPELSDYARSKRDGERVLAAYPQLSWTVLRPPAVYGAGDRELAPLLSWVRRGIAVRPGPREQRLSLLEVTDLARAVACWAAQPAPCRHGCYAIHDGHCGGYAWRAIALAVRARPALEIGLPRGLLELLSRLNRLAASLLDYPPMLTPGKVRELCEPRWVCDNAAFSRATGWRPHVDLAHGARMLFDGESPNRENSTP